jgi:hypothetical protein
MFDRSDTPAEPGERPVSAYAAMTHVDSRTRRAIVARERPGTQ